MSETTTELITTTGEHSESSSRRKRTPRTGGMPQPVAIIIASLGFLLVWQLVVLSGMVPSLLLPGPVDVASEIGVVFMQLVSPDGFLAGQLWITVQEIIAGFLLAVCIGVLIGLWVGLTNFGRKAVMPLFVMLEATPKIAFIPVFIAWFGFGLMSKIVMAAFLSVFPVIIGMVSGLNATSVEERKLFLSLNASPWATFWKLRLHRALPFLFAGLKVAVVASVTGAVAAEFIGGGTGFGEQVRVAATQINLDRVFAMIFYLSALGLTAFLLVSWMQRKLTFWDMEIIPRKKKSER